jgi:SPP1 family predicted phage head-tail adaptor
MKTILQATTPIFQAGKLRHRVQIMKLNTTTDTAGGDPLSNVTLVREVWATIEALSGTEKFAAHEFTSQVSHSVYIRYQPDLRIDASMQVYFPDMLISPTIVRKFQIEAVLNPDERRKVLQLLCVEINDSLQQV